MMAWRGFRGLGLAAGVSVYALLGGVANADYENALNAYLMAKGSEASENVVIGAMDLWQKSALAGDVRSARILGDLYSDQDLLPGDGDMLPSATGVVPYDLEEALAWYIIAATHDFAAYQQTNPLAEEYNARTVAQRRIPELKLLMSDASVRAAETRVEQLLGGGTAFDLLRLGKMRARGHGLTKDNIEALKYLYLARGRGRGTSVDASALIENLEGLMVQSDVSTADLRADEWQPPLPDTYAILTRKERRDAQRLTQLQYQELRENLERLDREFQGNDVVIDKALQALGFYYDQDNDGKLESSERRDAIKRFQKALALEELRQGAPNDEPLTEDERALIRDRATGTLADLQIVALMKRAAERGHAPSQHIYGIMLGRGIGVLKNGRDAIRMLKASAEQNYALAHYSAGIFYAEGITAPEPLRQSVSEACFHLSRAAVLGYDKADKAQKTYCDFD